MPWWWRWYSYADPVSWTLYGLVASQLGDLRTGCLAGAPGGACVSPAAFLQQRFGYEHDFLGVVAVFLLLFCLVFAAVAAVAHTVLNFQRR